MPKWYKEVKVGPDGFFHTESELHKITPEEERSAKRPRTGDPIPPLDEDVTMAEPEVTAERSSGNQTTGRTKAGAHETAVIPHSPAFRFPETFTQIVPVTFFLSMNKTAFASTTKNKLELRMNSPYSVFCNSGDLQTQTAGAAVVEGLSVVPAPDADTQPGTLLSFPTTYTTSLRAQYLQWYGQMYDVYTVLQTEYEVNIVPARSTNTAKNIVFWEMDAYGTSSTGNTMPAADVETMMNWPGVKQITFSNLDNDQAKEHPPYATVKGTWLPGQHSRNTFNDGDIQTWVATGAPPGNPSYTESLHLRFFRAPLSALATSTVTGCNIMIRLKYTVQFKDLKQDFRYPGGTSATAISLATTDLRKVA